MIKFLLYLCMLIALYGAWIVAVKIYKTQRYLKNKQKEKIVVQQAVTTELKHAREAQVASVDAYEIDLFDDIAKLFFQEQDAINDLSQAQQIQQDWLNKMPMQTTTQIRYMDLGEWSIYWNFYDQSLEYYVGRYGVFYAHVDQHGKEHKFEPCIEKNHVDYA